MQATGARAMVMHSFCMSLETTDLHEKLGVSQPILIDTFLLSYIMALYFNTCGYFCGPNIKHYRTPPPPTLWKLLVLYTCSGI